MVQKSRWIAAAGIAVLLALLPASASANVGGASPRLMSLDADDATKVGNVGGAGPRAGEELLQENVGGASPRDKRDKNVGGAGPYIENVGGAAKNVGGARPTSPILTDGKGVGTRDFIGLLSSAWLKLLSSLP